MTITCDWVSVGVADSRDYQPGKFRCDLPASVAAELTIAGHVFAVAYCARHWSEYQRRTGAVVRDRVTVGACSSS